MNYLFKKDETVLNQENVRCKIRFIKVENDGNYYRVQVIGKKKV
jgi:hypothetical protein